MKEKITYSEKYRKPYPVLREDDLPVLNNINEGFKCTRAVIKEAGKVIINGKEMEYQDMRVYIE